MSNLIPFPTSRQVFVPSTRNTMSFDMILLIANLCREHGLTIEQTADVFILLEQKGYYA